MRSEANQEIEVKCMCNTLNFNLPQFNKAYRLFWKLLFGLWLLCTVAWTSHCSVRNASSVVLTTNDCVVHTNVLHTSTTHEDHWVFLQVVLNTWDVRSNFHTVWKTNTSNLSDRRVRLTWSLGRYLGTYTTLKWWVVRVRLVDDWVEPNRQGASLRTSDRITALLLG